METSEKDAAAVRISPPLVFGVAIAAGFLLQRYALPLPLGLPEAVRTAAKLGAALFGGGLIVVALALFHRTKQDPRPWESTPEIVNRGAYRWSRNPMYLGMALIQGALGLSRSNGWVLLLLPPALVVVYWTAIRHEEAYLERKFGNSYLEYKREVRRWL
jgi:protein-S-isoprenylcysteine O-methyltransferase Ste14